MPIYEYECQKCGKRFEYLQSMSDPAKKKCEACAGKLERLISHSAFHLKGAGWYKDLYSKKPGASGESRSEGSSPAPSKPAEAPKGKATKGAAKE